MNSCGVNIPEIFNSFFKNNEEATEMIKDYYFSEWYDTINENSNTIKSYIFDYNELYGCSIDKLIKKLPGRYCFARLDTCSSKPDAPFMSSQEILDSLQNSDRTREYCDTDMKVIIREYVDIDEEFRCYFHEGILRGISGLDRELDKKERDNILNFAYRAKFYSEFNDCCIDIGYVNKQLTVIEINTPVYLCGSSGYFDLNVPSDYEILLGEYRPEVILYPVIR